MSSSFSKNILFLLFSCCHSASLFAAGKTIFLSVSVNGVSFTNRQVLIYMNFREALRNQQELALVAEQEYEVAQRVFVEEMVVLQEQQRMSGYQVSKEMLETSLKKLSEKRRSHPAFDNFWKEQKPSGSEVKRFISEILSITYYRETRSKRAKDFAAKSDSESNWIRPLIDRAIIRYYDRPSSVSSAQ